MNEITSILDGITKSLARRKRWLRQKVRYTIRLFTMLST